MQLLQANSRIGLVIAMPVIISQTAQQSPVFPFSGQYPSSRVPLSVPAAMAAKKRGALVSAM